MNATMQRFGYPDSIVHEYLHWAVMIRPAQLTLGCTIIAAKADCTSLGALSADAGAELPRVIGDFEAAIRRIAPVSKFNYLALMMVDPNPHFHAVPRYAEPVAAVDTSFGDETYPQPPDLRRVVSLTPEQLERLRRLLVDCWPEQA
jgi:diadenosine tetraphosphate (Ap4A) HIT family hydrolase